MATCGGMTKNGTPCMIKSNHGYCHKHKAAYKVRNESDEADMYDKMEQEMQKHMEILKIAEKNAQKGIITYPCASSFIEWLVPLLKTHDVPYKNENTGGDYYELYIGKKLITLDWKYLGTEDIDEANDALKVYGYTVVYDNFGHGYKTMLNKI